MSTLFNPSVAGLSVANSSMVFPVGRLICVGRNYAAHAQEMGSSGVEPPFFFMKAVNSLWDLARQGAAWPYPRGTQDCHHELEIVLALGPTSGPGEAGAELFGLALGLDMTRRDRQAEMKSQGKPWEVGKAFPHAAPTTAILPLSSLGLSSDPAELQQALASTELRLSIDGEVRQSGSPRQMLCPIPELLQNIRAEFDLLPGDLIFTGTPSGVGPVVPGQSLRGELLAVENGSPRLLLPELQLQVHHSLQDPL